MQESTRNANQGPAYTATKSYYMSYGELGISHVVIGHQMAMGQKLEQHCVHLKDVNHIKVLKSSVLYTDD